MNRRYAVSALFALGALPLASLAQKQDKTSRVGFLAILSPSSPSNPNVYYDAFVKGMRELGYVEGRNLIIEWRFAEGRYERLPRLAAELVNAQVQVIVTHATPGTRAAQQATRTIPIVTAASIDPVGNGFAASLARPGSNVTGMTVDVGTDLLIKRLDLLRTAVPRLATLGVLANPGSPGHLILVKDLQKIAEPRALRVLVINAATLPEIESGYKTLARERADAAMVLPDGFFLGHGASIAEQALRAKLATIAPWREHVAAGLLMSYGQNVTDTFHDAAIFVDKILKGAKPSELPFQQPAQTHLAINRKTAKALGIIIPQDLLLRADEIIN